MTTSAVRILHASDLHISVYERLRSPLDLLGDLDDPLDMSARGVADKQRLLKNLIKAWREKRAASSYDPKALHALAEFIYENAKRKLDADGKEITEEGDGKLDAVIITGDLATTGSVDDVEMVEKFLSAEFDPRVPHRSVEGDYRRATLSAVTIPILCLPGNHDRFVPTLDLYRHKYPIFFAPGGTEFDLQIANYSHASVRDPVLLTGDLSQGQRLKVAVLGADLTLRHFGEHEGFYGWLAQGKAHDDTCRSLVAATRWLRKQKSEGDILCVLWAIHFPPAFPGVRRHSRLLDERKFIEAANRAGVDAVLAGHTHQQATYRRPAMSFKVFCCGTTAQHEPRASVGGRDEQDPAKGNLFQIITITADSGGRVELSAKDYRYSNAGSRDGPADMRWVEVPAAF